MALSGKFLAAPLAAVMLLVGTGFVTPRFTDGALGGSLTTQVAEEQATEAAQGRPISRDDATATLEVQDGEAIQPVAAWRDQLLLRTDPGPTPTETPAPQFESWDPETGERQPAWTGEAGTQEIVTGVDGDWAAVVRTGFTLPFPEWELVLRNLATGETRVLAESDEGVLEEEGLEPGLPLGFAPFAAVHGGRVAWAQYAITGGAVERQLVLHEIDSSETSVVARIDPRAGNLDSPTLGGNRLAWARLSADGSRHQLVVRALKSGLERSYFVDGVPFLVALSADGQHIAWDDGMTAKYSLELRTLELTRFAQDEGWGVFAGGNRFAWAPGAAFGGAGGYFDAETGETRLIEQRDGVTSNVATLLGDWFAWQESTAAGTTYYFERLATGGKSE